MKKFLFHMQVLNPSSVASFVSFFATVKKLFIGMKMGNFLIVFIIFMGVLITFGNRGLVDNYIMRDKLAALAKLNQDMAVENQSLRSNIALLRSDLAYIEMIARNEFGMVRKGDLVYRYAR